MSSNYKGNKPYSPSFIEYPSNRTFNQWRRSIMHHTYQVTTSSRSFPEGFGAPELARLLQELGFEVTEPTIPGDCYEITGPTTLEKRIERMEELEELLEGFASCEVTTIPEPTIIINLEDTL